MTASATSPALKDISPTGGQRGTEMEVSFQGERLQDTEEVLCYEPGIQVLKLVSATNNLVKAQVKLLPDCPLGEHHLRLRTSSGLSELRTFFAGSFPIVEEVEPNNDRTNAQKIALNTTVTGVIKSEDVDCFAIELKKGQRLSAEVEGMRLGRAPFDPRLAVLGPDGLVVADVDDTWLGMQDPFISLVATQDGMYVVRLREATYGGADNYHYRLHVGSFPRPTMVFPLGGQSGQNLSLTCFSEPTGDFPFPIKLPDSSSDKFSVFPESDGLPAPTPNWIRVCAFTNVLASPTNHNREQATAAGQPPPFALNGILAQKAQEDWFSFPAPKGAALALNVYARRLRSPVDSVIEVYDPNGKQIAANDDASGADSALKFTPSETTNYFVRVRDTLGQAGRDFAYRIEIVPVEPGLGVKIPEVSRNDTQSRQFAAVPRGNRFATLVAVKRSDFGGELSLTTDELPKGLTMLSQGVAANVDSIPVVFEAAADAPIGGRLLDLAATWTNASSKVVGHFRQQVDLVEGPNNTTFYSTSVDKFCVAVTKEAPFHLRITQPKVPLVQSGTMRLEVIAEREPGFTEPIEVQMVWNPPGISSDSEVTIPKDATNAFYRLSAGGGAEARTWKIALLGHATVEGGQVYVSSQLADLEIAKPFLTGKIETLWLNPGKTAKLTVNLQPAKPFEGKAKIQLRGLPDKVSAPEKEISKDDQEVAFEVTAEPGCAAGSHRNLYCEVEVKQAGESILHNIASGGILRIVPPKAGDTKVASAAKK